MSDLVYEDFTVRVERSDDGQSYWALVTESAGGEGRASFTHTELFGDAAATIAAPAIDAMARNMVLVGKSHTLIAIATPGLQNPAAAKKYGWQLFQAISRNRFGIDL